MAAKYEDGLPGLSMEARTGIKHEDIDDFLEKANAMQAKIDAIKNGEISVEELQAEAAAEEAEKAAAAAAKQKRLADIAKREAIRLAREKEDEHAQWWAGADVLYPLDEAAAPDDTAQDATGETARDAALKKYENDYGRWDEGRWTPSDPATAEEEAEKERKKTEKENAQFEKDNKKFCDDFILDQKQREQRREKQDETAGALRLKGNRYFKAKKFDDALKLYKESLGSRAYEKSTLLNVAQVHLKMRRWDEAVEFSSRAVRIGGRGDFKARARRAAAKSGRAGPGDLKGAVEDLEQACRALHPADTAEREKALNAVVTQLQAARQALRDAEAETVVEEKAKAPEPPPATPAEESEHLLEALKGLADLGTGPEAADAALRQALDLAAKSGESRGLQTARDAMGDDMDEAGLAKLAGALRSSRDARVLCRTRGGLERLLARLGSRPTKDAGSIELHVDGFDLDDAAGGVDLDAALKSDAPVTTPKAAGLVLSTLAAAIREEPKSKKRAVDAGAVEVLVQRLTDAAHGAEADGMRAAACEVAAELAAEDARSPPSVAAVLKDAALLAALSQACDGGALSLERKTNPATLLPRVAGAAHAAKALRDLAGGEELLAAEPCCVAALAALCRGSLTAGSPEARARAAAAAARALKQGAKPGGLAALGDPEALCGAIAGECVEYATKALARLARAPAARPRFAEAIRDERTAAATPAGILLGVARSATPDADTRAAALVGLSNACLDKPGALVVKACEAAGGVAASFSLVRKPATDENLFDVRCRAAGLLARLSTAGGAEGSAARTLRAAPKALRQLMDAVNRASKRSDAWAETERDHLVRAVAGVLGSDASPEAVGAFLQDNGYRDVVRVLPEPQDDLGTVTAHSVSQSPKDRVSANCAGNAAKVLLAGLSNTDEKLRRGVAAELVQAGGLERLICALANYKELAVRRNVAVCMAKTMAHSDEAVKDRVRELRGMEMITTLGNKLV